MHESTFNELLTSLNRGESQKLTFSRPLTTTVELANHWTPGKGAAGEGVVLYGPDTIYLVRQFEGGPFIGLVQEASLYDLHWYSLPEYRGKGYLSAALKSVVLPHLFQDNRDFQHITIDGTVLNEENFQASVRLAKAVGFKYTHEESGVIHYKIGRGMFNRRAYIDGELSPLTDVRAKEIRKEISDHFTLLEVLQSELEMKLGNTRDLFQIKKDLDLLKCNFDSVVSDAYMDHRILYVKNL
ncbi:GNAT family N-acetyltransferase [Pedobacter sp. GR22-6]|uniref:GNAT family N-acetyltransferase n=1 Tax=Pedobacter sp. GR22-6 TaxID=3127957 RepID=UPI00307E4989